MQLYIHTYIYNYNIIITIPDLPWSFSAIEFQFCAPYCSTSCRSFSSSAGLQCPLGQVFESSEQPGPESSMEKAKKRERERFSWRPPPRRLAVAEVGYIKEEAIERGIRVDRERGVEKKII